MVTVSRRLKICLGSRRFVEEVEDLSRRSKIGPGSESLLPSQHTFSPGYTEHWRGSG